MIWLIPVLPILFAVCGFFRKRALMNLTTLGNFGLLIFVLTFVSKVARVKAIAQSGGFFYLDSLSAVFLVLISVVSCIAGIYASVYFKREVAEAKSGPDKPFEYHFWMNLLVASMYMVVLTANMGIMWVAIEATTVTSVLLVAYDRQKNSIEAAWKYVLICSVGIIFALIGIMLFNFSASHLSGGTTLDWRTLLLSAPSLKKNLIKTAFIFVLIGFGTKVGFAPLHTWLPDAHSQAPTPVSAMLSGVLLNCALYGIIRMATIVTACTGAGFVNQFWTFFGLASLAVAAPFILIQTDLKRLLAYSSIENMGIIAFALGIGGKWGVIGALAQIVNHGLTKAGLFLTSGEVVHLYHSKRIRRIKGIFKAFPGVGMIFFGYFLILSGAPPFAIFFSKMTMIYGALQRYQYGQLIMFLFLILAVFGGLLVHFSRMALGQPPLKKGLQEHERRNYRKMVFILAVPIVILAIFGLYQPPLWRNLIGEAARIIGGVR